MNRTLNILKAFGFQGGTIHQVAELTGCDAFELLYSEYKEKAIDFRDGVNCSKTYKGTNMFKTIAENRQSNLLFWLGVASVE